MLIGIAQVSFQIPDSHSLKEKRAVMNSLKGRLRSRFNISVAETDELDTRSKGVLAIAAVSNEKQHLHKILSNIVSFIEGDKRLAVMDVNTDII